MRPRLLSVLSLGVLVFSGCTTTPSTSQTPAPTATPGTPHLAPAGPAAPAAPAAALAAPATIRGSEESSVMLDNFTAFISAVDHHPVAAGRAGWNTPLELKAGRHELTVEFRRGVFNARTQLVLEAAANASYQLKYTTDAELFGKNSFCDFWVVDLATNQPVTAIKKASVGKGG